MQALSGGRVRRSRAEWQEFVRRFEESDLNEAAFCRHEKISRSSFIKWRRKLEASSPARPAPFIEMAPIPRPETNHPSGGEFELCLPGGVTLRWKA